MKMGNTVWQEKQCAARSAPLIRIGLIFIGTT